MTAPLWTGPDLADALRARLEGPSPAAIGGVSITPLVRGAGSGLTCFGGSAAVEAVISERARWVGRGAGIATGSGAADAT